MVGSKQLAALGALVCVATPVIAADDFALKDPSPGVKFYVSLPLDGRGAKQQAPSFGMALQGNRAYETVYLDSRMFNFAEGVFGAKMIVAGVVAAGAIAVVTHKDKKKSESYQQQQAQQQEQNPCPVTPNC